MSRQWTAWPEARLQPLPRAVIPFANELVGSFVRRLAAANRIPVVELRYFLSDPAKPSRYSPPQLDGLAAVSGQPRAILERRLRGLDASERNGRRQHLAVRPACRRCMARRGVLDTVECWLPAHLNICPRHLLWVGPPVHDTVDQIDVSGLPEILSSQRRYARLRLRLGNEKAAAAFEEASLIVRRWTERGYWPQQRQRRASVLFGSERQRITADHIVNHVAGYPDAVTLTSLLTSEHWQRVIANDIQTYHSDRIDDFTRKRAGAFYAEVGRRLRVDYEPIGLEPLATWVRDQWLRQRPTSYRLKYIGSIDPSNG